MSRLPRRILAGAGLAAAIAACARIGSPPGGPEDKAPPRLLATTPESLAIIPDFKGSVELQFDETLSEGGTPSLGTGTSDLERVVLLSPSNNVPEVGWHRSRLAIRPKEGWKPNRVYRVQLLPGVKDIRNNRADTSIVITFTTGAALPTATLTGRVIDWESRKLPPNTLIEAILDPDSLPYRALTDTSGRFSIGPLPAGSYLVFAVDDQNHNHKRENRERFDSARVDSVTTAVPVLWLQPHDTLPPRIQSITPTDSSSATVLFTGPLDPYAPPPFASLRFVTLPDSTPVDSTILLTPQADSIDRVRRKAVADSIAALSDTTRARSDTTKKQGAETPRPAPSPPRPPAGQRPSSLRPISTRPAPDTTGLGALLASRPVLNDKLILRVPGHFEPGKKYALEIQALRGLTGKPGDVRAGLIVPVPKPAKVDSTKALTDTSKVHPDSARVDSTSARPDSLKPSSSRTRADSARADSLRKKGQPQ
ncbi:MAG TPA: Ig-like domain-containing protein [Gemmatimonadales bacterium]|nr:Ig-like domain-containing protein [Gemmatimonadales bacterium]